MARGWESKAVEAQMEEAREERQVAKVSTRAGDGEVSRERRSLMLAKTRIVNELHTTANPRYRDLLETSLAAIDQQLSVPLPA